MGLSGCPPINVGQKHLKRVQLVLTDGDSSEYNALDESILKENLGNALRGRCGHHLIKKSLQKHGPVYAKLGANEKAMMDEIERWVRSWGDGSSCSTQNQFEFSKDLLLKELQKNKAIRTGLGEKEENADKISQWINNHILPQEQNNACMST